ncbi:MAG TPA: pitrilysin family protein [Longimicrobiales bacterium]|nr:pitrilysin family protein [Longimicrobiales bacterium]
MDATSILSRLPTHERRLDNGLTVLVREDHSAPVVAIVTHVRAGYFNEPDRLVGISHVLEHMYFKGTERRGAGEIAQETKAAGGFLNAATIYDYTYYYTVLPASSLEMGLDIQADALRNSEINEEELRKELLVIIQEARRKLDNPDAVATEALFEEMFEVHRIRRWRIGTEEELRRLTRKDVWEYYCNLYRPSNIVLVVAGDVDPERTFELVERHYGDMPAGEPVKETSPEEPPRRGFRLREMAGDIVHSYAELGWRTPGTTHEDTPALDVLAVVLGQGRASRLYQGVRELGLVTSIQSQNYTPTELGVFGISAELRPESAPAALEAIAREVEGVRAAPVTSRELERARNILEARVVRRVETAEGQANLLADWQALGDWRLAERYLERLAATTLEDLHRVAEEYLDLDATTLLLYRPREAPPLGVDAPTLREVLRQAAATARPVRETEPPELPVPLELVPPQSVRVEDDVHFYDLADGTRLAVKPRRSTPLVSMTIAFRGGSAHEEPANAGLTSLMARASVKGTARRTAAELAEATESLGGAISPSVGADTFSWSLSLPSRHFERGFALLADPALHPSFPEPEVERERKVALSDLERVRDDTYDYPMQLFLETAFAGSSYGLTLADAEATMRRAGREEVAAWHRREVLEGERWVLVVGDVDPDTAAAVVARELEALEPPRPRGPARLPRWPATPASLEATLAKAQTALALGFPGPDRSDPDRYAVQVLSSVVSGLGGRFFEELRGRRSLSYTVAAYPITRWLAGAFVAYMATAPEQEEEARAALLREFEKLREEPVTADELERAKRYTIGAWQIRQQTNGAQLGNILGAVMLGSGLDEVREFEKRIRAVTPEAILGVARRYFEPERMVQGIVRGSGGGR